MTTAPIPETKRIRGTLVGVDPKPEMVGDKKIPKLSFQAKDASGKELNCYTFRTSLFGALQEAVGKEVDLDVSEDEYQGKIRYKMSQIYLDGQPAISKAQGKFQRPWGKDPQERASIEAQVALKEAGNLIVAGRADLKDLESLAKRCFDILRHLQLGEAGLGEATPKPAPAPLVATQATVSPVPEPDICEQERRALQNNGDLMRWAKKWYGKSHQDVLSALNVNRGQDILTLAPESALKLNEAWGMPKEGTV